MPTTTPTSNSFGSSRSIPTYSAPPEAAAARGRRLVVVGGGTGLATLLRGLKHLVGRGGLEELTAVVTVSDDGGSSGRLRRDFGVLPPGDIRNCIVALADDEALLSQLFQYRFSNGEGLEGHSFGNLLLTALTGITGDFYQAILTAESILSVRGRILPATLIDVELRGRGLSGRVYEGESAVGKSGERLVRLALEPPSAAAFPPAVEALERADMILLGPGSLYTSILPNLLIPEICRAIRCNSGKVVLVLNLMTQPGETDDMDALDHLEAIKLHAGCALVDVVLVNSARPSSTLLAQYAQASSRLVGVGSAKVLDPSVELVQQDLLADGALIRHDPGKLSQAVLSLMKSHSEETAAAGTRESR